MKKRGNRRVPFGGHGLERLVPLTHGTGWTGSCGHGKQPQKPGLQAPAEFTYNDDQQLTVFPTVHLAKVWVPWSVGLVPLLPSFLSGVLYLLD